MSPFYSEPIIKFAETKLSVHEPKESGKMSVVRIPVLRVGDSSRVSVVRVHTKDGSALSGEDYHPISQGKEAHSTLQRQATFISFQLLYLDKSWVGKSSYIIMSCKFTWSHTIPYTVWHAVKCLFHNIKKNLIKKQKLYKIKTIYSIVTQSYTNDRYCNIIIIWCNYLK